MSDIEKYDGVNVEIIPIEGLFTIYFNATLAGHARLTQRGMEVYNVNDQLVFEKDEMRLHYRRQLLHQGIAALLEHINNPN